MKRILSLIIVVTVLFGMFSFNAYAAEEEEALKQACYRINWATQSFFTYTYNETKTNDNYMKYFNVDKTSRYIYTLGTTNYEGSTGGRAYFSQQMFEINDSTHYEYIFKAKNNLDGEYAGVVFAFGNGLAYIMYGSFNNTAKSSNTGVSSINLTKGLHASSSKDCSTGFSERLFTADLDSDGFGHYKIVYKGYNVSVYALTDSEKEVYTQIGSSIKLPIGSKVALGVYAMTATKGPNRTVNLSDCLLYAMNTQTRDIISTNDDGTSRLSNLIKEAKTNYSAADNTGATYRELMREVEAAEQLLDRWDFTATEISEAEKNLDDALDQMEIKEADLTELKKVIDTFEALNVKSYTDISYKMVADVVADAKELLTKDSVRQTRVNDAVARILDRMEMLVPTGYVEPETEVLESDIESESSTETDYSINEKGCKSVVVGASAFAVAALIGVSSLIVKKKED